MENGESERIVVDYADEAERDPTLKEISNLVNRDFFSQCDKPRASGLSKHNQQLS